MGIVIGDREVTKVVGGAVRLTDMYIEEGVVLWLGCFSFFLGGLHSQRVCLVVGRSVSLRCPFFVLYLP